MKPIYYISLMLCLCAFTQDGFSQERRTRQRPSEVGADNLPTLSERAKIKNETESKPAAHIAWVREIYRYIDLTQENNSPLYYPTQPIGNRMNLFTLLFKLMSDNKIVAYNYLDGREIFTEEQKINFEDVLKRFQILYTTQGNRFVVEDSDVPSEEVTMYMIKEGYYFDQATGSFQSQVLAICPMLVREDYYYGGTPTRDPLFWIPYDELRPYLSREMIMTSNYNNALTYTMDDYFRKQMYKGEIVKTTNLMNKSLAQEVGSDPAALKLANDSIENQLKAFEKGLWVYPPAEKPKVEGEESTAKEEKTKKEKKTGRGSSSSVKEKKTKSEKSSSPTKSVRRTRK